MAADKPRGDTAIGPESGPEPPYPLRMEGTVITGFGRGSSELGIPTANLPVDASLTPWIESISSGVYFGYASLALPPTHRDLPAQPPSSFPSSQYYTFPMVMSIGYNPFYKNTVRSAEVYLVHRFAQDFYGVPMRLLLLGFVRPELDYNGVEALIADIKTDRDQTLTSLRRRGWIPRTGSWMPVVDSETRDPTGELTWETGAFDGDWLVREAEEAAEKAS